VDAVLLVGRILFALHFVANGLIFQLGRFPRAARYASSSGVPAAGLVTALWGAAMVVGGLMVASGIWLDLGGLLIAIFSLTTAPFMHAFWRSDDPRDRISLRTHFTLDLTVAGAGMIIFALFSSGADPGPAWVGGLFEF
jgi:putative oxidoreductase